MIHPLVKELQALNLNSATMPDSCTGGSLVMEMLHLDYLMGKTLTSVRLIENEDERRNKHMIEFITSDGEYLVMYHPEQLGEQVILESCVGDLQDLVGTPITFADESTNKERPISEALDKCDTEYHMWTFYKLATVKGWVDLRWCGGSNGYYSVAVDFVKIHGQCPFHIKTWPDRILDLWTLTPEERFEIQKRNEAWRPKE